MTPEPPEARRPSFLIVHKDPRHLVKLLRVVGKFSNICQTASGTVEALEKIRREPFDIVIADARLTASEGPDWTLRAREVTPATSFLFVSDGGGPSAGPMPSGLFSPARKPLSVSGLRHRLKRLCLEMPHARFRGKIPSA